MVGAGGDSTAAGGGSEGGADAGAGGAPTTSPIVFHCRFDETCPSLTIGGDPPASSGFNGYGDPSLERDPGGALWLAYSWLDEQSLPGDPTPLHAVRTHLARSDDDGDSFAFVRAVNTAAPAPGDIALVIHEVPSLAQRGDHTWGATWLSYALFPSGDSAEFFYARSLAATPDALGDTIDPWLKGNATTVETTLTGETLPGLEDCLAFTEPALFADAGIDYLATNCVVDPTRPETQRLVLLRETSDSLTLVGDLLDAADVAALGATRVEQLDLALASDGAILALVTPIDDAAAIPHRGCIVLEFEELTTARLRRNSSGELVRRAVITGDGDGIGPGLCTYDRSASTGVLLTLTQVVDAAALHVEFSLHATGVHP